MCSKLLHDQFLFKSEEKKKVHGSNKYFHHLYMDSTDINLDVLLDIGRFYIDRI